MKIQLRVLILLAAVMVGSGEVWGEYYALSNQGTGSVELMNGWSVASNKEYTLSGPGKVLSFDVEKTAGTATGNITVKAGDITIKTISMSDLSKNTWKSYSVDLTAQGNYRTNRKITFSASGTLTKYLRSAQVTMAQYIDNPSSTAEMAWGAGKVDDTHVTKSVTIAWCNVPAMTTSVSGTGSDKVSVSIENNSSAGKYGTATVKVTYNRNAASTLNATLTISNTYGSYSKSIKLTGSTSKYDQTLSWVNEAGIEQNMVVGGNSQTIAATATSGLGVSYASSNSNILSINSNGVLTTSTTQIGDGITITASQAGDYKYNAAPSITKTFHVKNKLVPTFTLNNDAGLNGTSLYVGGTATVGYYNTDANLQVQTSKDGYVGLTHNATTYTITAQKAGEVNVIFTQHSSATLQDGGRTFAFTILGNPTGLAFNAVPDQLTVGQEIANPFTSANSTAPKFTSNPEGYVTYENGKLKVLKACDQDNVTITFTQDATTYYAAAEISKTVSVVRNNPNFTWDIPASCNWNTTYAGKISSANTTNPLIITSNKPSVANVVNGNIVVYNQEGTVTFTITQEQTDYYAGINTTKTLNVTRAANHVPFTMNETLYNTLKGATSGDQAWDSGIKLGAAGSVFNWDDKARVFGPFDGISGTLSTNYSCSEGATDCVWIIKESTDGSSWKDVINHSCATGTSNGSSGTFNASLSPSAKYIQFIWSGNCAGYFQNITITERKEIAATNQDFGQAYIGANATVQNILVDWYNVGPITVTSNNSQFEVVTTGINSSLDNYATGVPVQVKYKHDVAGQHQGTITFTALTGETKTITVTGKTNKNLQSITWKENLTPMPLGIDETAAATASSGEAVTFTSSNSDVIVIINGTTLHPVGPGTATITASQVGNNLYEAIQDQKEIEVTAKEVQYITWNDNLSNIKYTGTSIQKTLTATASTGLPITWSIDPAGAAVATLEGNVLTIKGIGTTYVTASQAGNDTYVAVNYTKKVVVRDPNSGCNPLVAEQSSEYSLWTIAEAVYDLSGEPGEITLKAHKQSGALGGIHIAQYYDGNYHDVASLDEGSSYQNYGPYTLNRKATKVKIYTKGGATLYHYFTNMEVTLAQYLESDYSTDGLNFTNTQYNTYVEKSLPIRYSNITGVLDVEILNNTGNRFTVNQTTIGEDCGDYGTANLMVRYEGNALTDVENAQIKISNSTQSLLIPLKGSVIKLNQQITWNNTDYEVSALDNVTLDATTTGTGLTVSFASEDNSIAEVVNGNQLLIHKTGTVDITASQAGNDAYTAAPSVKKTFTIIAATPVITTAPTAEEITIAPSLTISAANLMGGAASVDGTFAWKAPETAITAAGTENYPVVFTPSNSDLYTTAECQVALTVNKNAQTITWEMEDNGEQYCYEALQLDATASSELDVTYSISDPTIAVLNADNSVQVNKAGTVTITASQAGNLYYAAAASIVKTVTFQKATSVITVEPTCKRIRSGEYLDDTYLQGGEAQINSTIITGTFHWNDPTIPTGTLTEGTYFYNADFVPANQEWFTNANCSVRVVARPSVFEYEGNNTGQPTVWSDNENWKIGSASTNDDDDVKVNADVLITTDVTIQGLTISEGNKVIIQSNASLTITGSTPINQTNYGNIQLEAGGQLTFVGDGELKVQDLIISSQVGDNAQSGQIINAGNMTCQGDAYIDITLDASGDASYGWYAFAVPFEVDVNKGVYTTNGVQLTNEKDYAVMQYQGDVRAQGEYGWIKVRKVAKTLKPGVFYLMTVGDTDYATLRFKKTADGALDNSSDNLALQEFAASGKGEDHKDNGWNGVANPGLHYVQATFGTGEEEKVQVYSHANNSFDAIALSASEFVVGAPFFAKWVNGDGMSLNLPTTIVSAPRARGAKEFNVRIGKEGAQYDDQLYLSATEDASLDYEEGHDLVKATMGTANVAQMYIDAYDHTALCDAEFRLENHQAIFPMVITTPKAGSYEIYMNNGPADSHLYLMREDVVVWDLSKGAYTVDLPKGTTSSYSLKIATERGVTTEDVALSAEKEGVEKRIINQQLYILRNGKVYSVQGAIAR